MTLTKTEEAQRRIIRGYGAEAFIKGTRTYDENPYQEWQKSFRLWWSEGYNGARAKAISQE